MSRRRKEKRKLEARVTQQQQQAVIKVMEKTFYCKENILSDGFIHRQKMLTNHRRAPHWQSQLPPTDTPLTAAQPGINSLREGERARHNTEHNTGSQVSASLAAAE